MKREPGFLYRIFLVIGDAFAIVAAFAFAYFFRVRIDSRPYFFTSQITDFIISNLILLPIWLIVLSSLGLYSKRILARRGQQYWRIFLASIIGIMAIIGYDFFATGINMARGSIFPVKIIALYAMGFCFLSMILARSIISLLRKIFMRNSLGLLRTVVVGDGANVVQLLGGISPETGFKVVGVVTNKEVPKEWRKRKYANIDIAMKNLRPDAMIHVSDKDVEEYNKIAIDHHALYFNSPSDSAILLLGKNVDFIAGVPLIRVHVTPLIGGARLYKRIMDIIASVLLATLASPIMLIIFIMQKLIEPKAPAIYKDLRLTQFDREFHLLKFRSIKQEYSGLTPEQAFAKMGKPELATKYRDQGDYLKNDPRYTSFGRFLRSSSLDELPQLFNVIKGDISLIGPRALQPTDLKHYGDRGLLLSVKSGLTGLAQVSGRRNISFSERRALDIYYIQNWTPGLDIQILIRTIICVLLGIGAK